MVAGPVSSGIVSGTTAMLAPWWPADERRAASSSISSALELCLGRLGVEHAQRRRQQQQPPPTWKLASEMPKNSRICRPSSALAAITTNAAERRDPDRALALRAREILRVVDEERHDRQRVDDGQQRDQRLEVHGDAAAVRRDRSQASAPPLTSRMDAGGVAGLRATAARRWLCATSSAVPPLHRHQVGQVAHAVGLAARGMDLGLDDAPGAPR
jgi:hypothetical protein